MYNSTGPLLFCIYFWEILQEKWPENSYKITRWSQGLRLQCLFQTVFSCFQFKSPQVNSQKRETVSLSTLRSTLQSNCHFKSASEKAQQRLKCMPSTTVWFIRKNVVEPVYTVWPQPIWIKVRSSWQIPLTAAINEFLCLKNAGAQISLFFTSYE